jgi:hypothetical protein
MQHRETFQPPITDIIYTTKYFTIGKRNFHTCILRLEKMIPSDSTENINTAVPHDTTGLRPLKKWFYYEQSYHGVRLSVDVHVMNEDTLQNT